MTTTPFHRRPLVYVAGPYTNPDPVVNTRKAIEVAEALMVMSDDGVTAFVPHLSLLYHFHHPHDLEWWYEYDLAMLRRCDALWRFPGESTGADREVEFARQTGKPVFIANEDSVLDLLKWVEEVRHWEAITGEGEL